MSAPTGPLTNQADINYYNVGPLTTIWTPPDICLKTTTLVYNSGYATPYVMSSFTDATNAGVSIRAECYPSWTTSLTATLTDKLTLYNSLWPDTGFYFYSPGVCPEGWSAACTQTTMNGNVEYNNVGLSVGKDTTLAMCCPSGFTCGTMGTYMQRCIQNASGDLSNIAEWNTNTPPTITSLGTVNLQDAQSMSVSIIPILWQNSDTDVLSLMGITPTGAYAPTSSSTPAPSSTLSSAPKTTFDTASRTSSSISSSTSSTAPATGQKKTGISAGAKAGIAIGVIGAAALFAILLFTLLRRKKRAQEKAAPPAPTQTRSPSDLPELRSPLAAAALPATAEKHTAPEIDSTALPPPFVEQAPSPSHEMDGYIYNYDPNHASAYFQASEPEMRSLSRPLTTELPTPANKHEAAIASPTPVHRKPVYSPSPSAEYSHSELPADTRPSEANTSPSSATFATASPSSQSSPQRLDFLRSRIDAVRAEKERLNRMAELEALEMQLQREILEAQRAESGT